MKKDQIRYKGFRGSFSVPPKVHLLVIPDKPKLVIPLGCKMFILSTKTWKFLTPGEYQALPDTDKLYTLWDWASNKRNVKRKFKNQITQLHQSDAKKEELFKIIDNL